MTDDDKRAIFAAYAEATRACDTAGVVALCAEDVVLWHNFDEGEVRGEAVTAGLLWIHRVLPDVQWAEDRVLLTDGGFVWQAIIVGTGADGAVREPTCLVVTLDEHGKIGRMEEYLDSPWLKPLMDRR